MKEFEPPSRSNQCLINNNWLFYHAMSKNTLDAAKKVYYQYEYIGSSKVYNVDGYRQESKILYHFFHKGIQL